MDSFKQLLLLLWCIHLWVCTYSQNLERQVIANSGQLFSNASAQLDFTIGEVISTDFILSTHLTQGFQQGVYSIPLALEELSLSPIRISLDQVSVHWSWNGSSLPEQFLIQRKLANEQQFQTLYTIPSQLHKHDYNLIDLNSFKGLTYYRIVAVSFDREWISDIKSVDNPFFQIRLYPNPTSHTVHIQAALSNPKTTVLQMFDVKGVLVKQLDWPPNTTLFSISISNLPVGKYFITTGSITLTFLKN